MSAINPLTRDVSATDAWKTSGSGDMELKASEKARVRFRQPEKHNVPDVKLYYLDSSDGKWKLVPDTGLKSGQEYQLRVVNGADEVASFKSAWGPGLTRQLSMRTLNGDLKVSLSFVKTPNGTTSVRMLSLLDNSKWVPIDSNIAKKYILGKVPDADILYTKYEITDDKGKVLYTGEHPGDYNGNPIYIGPNQKMTITTKYQYKTLNGEMLVEVETNIKLGKYGKPVVTHRDSKSVEKFTKSY